MTAPPAAPYPAHLESTGAARDGTPVTLRPVHPEDEPLLQDLFAHMSDEDLRLRFFAPMRELRHELAARLTQLDYRRQMALVALRDDATLGIARYAATDSDPRRAEFAVAVRSDWKGRGVGYLLMSRLIDAAREAGFTELVGQVLHENHRMLDMCHALGFRLHADADDATLVQASKALTG